MAEDDPNEAPEPAEADLLLSDLPNRLAIFPLPGTILLPGGQLPLNIFEPRYLDMIRDAMTSSRMIGMIQPSDVSGGMDHPPIHSIGCAGAITSFKETDDGRFLITLTGIARFAVAQELETMTRYRQVHADWQSFEDDLKYDTSFDLDRAELETIMREFLNLHGMQVDWDAVQSANISALITFLAMAGPFQPNEKQALLETPNIEKRGELIIALMTMAIHAASSGGDGGQVH